jgi:hypothetical protein
MAATGIAKRLNAAYFQIGENETAGKVIKRLCMRDTFDCRESKRDGSYLIKFGSSAKIVAICPSIQIELARRGGFAPGQLVVQSPQVRYRVTALEQSVGQKRRSIRHNETRYIVCRDCA